MVHGKCLEVSRTCHVSGCLSLCIVSLSHAVTWKLLNRLSLLRLPCLCTGLKFSYLHSLMPCPPKYLSTSDAWAPTNQVYPQVFEPSSPSQVITIPDQNSLLPLLCGSSPSMVYSQHSSHFKWKENISQVILPCREPKLCKGFPVPSEKKAKPLQRSTSSIKIEPSNSLLNLSPDPCCTILPFPLTPLAL